MDSKPSAVSASASTSTWTTTAAIATPTSTSNSPLSSLSFSSVDAIKNDEMSMSAMHKPAASMDQNQEDNPSAQKATLTPTPPPMLTTLTAKYGKQTIKIPDLPSHSTTIATVKKFILEQTNILPERQKFIGLSLSKAASTNNTDAKRRKVIQDDVTLDKLEVKKPQKDTLKNDQNEIIHTYHSFILMGTPESEIFIDPDSISGDNKNNVVNDFDLDFNIGSSEWKEHFVNRKNLLKFTNSTDVHIMNPPRKGKKLMVLDLDHTLLDFSSRKIVNTARAATGASSGNSTSDVSADDSAVTDAAIQPVVAAASMNNNASPTASVQETINQMKRPFMDEFLSEMYVNYDLVVWSQTSWRWLETKLVELGMLTNPNYRFCFVLDKTSMFAITSTKRTGQKIKHYVKPLQIIWSKFPNVWDASNTIHLDDLSRNFALNLDNGLKVSGYYRKKKKNGRPSRSSTGKNDVELIGLIGYCTKLAKEVDDFRNVEFKYWKDVVNGTKALLPKKE